MGIRDARLAQGLSQHRLAGLAGVSRAWLARFETGHRKAEFELLMRTLEALGLSFSIGPGGAISSRPNPALPGRPAAGEPGGPPGEGAGAWHPRRPGVAAVGDGLEYSATMHARLSRS